MRTSSGTSGVPGACSRTALATSPASWASGTQRAEGTAASACRGIDGKSASSGSWTMQAPPYRSIHSRPAAPSSSSPVSTTPTTCGPRARAADRIIASCEGRWPFSRAPGPSATVPSTTSRCASGWATTIRPGSSGCPSFAATTGSGLARSRMSASRLRDVGGTCRPTSTVAGRSLGSPATNTFNASTPPAEPPTTTRSRRRSSALVTSLPYPVPGRSPDSLEHLVADVEVGPHVLHVVEVLEGVDELEHLDRDVVLQRHRDARHPGDVGRVDRQAGVRAGDPDRMRVGRVSDDLERLAEVVDLLGPRFEHGDQDVVLGQPVGLRHQHDALAVEQVRHRAGVSGVAAVAGDRRPHLGCGPVPVVGQALDHDRDAAGGVRLVGDLLVRRSVTQLAAAALDRPVDVVVGDRLPLGLGDGVRQRRVARGVAAAGPRGHLNRLGQLCEQLAALGVDDRLLVLRGRPLGVAAHEFCSLTMRTNSSCTRPSPVSSGWNDVASSAPRRTATTLPAAGAPAGTVASTSTSSPARSTHGARMKTAWTSPTSVIGRSASNDSTCRPKALRRTAMSSP